MLCERYATSKLEKIEDLRDIRTFGFRGEALASISHVARITITSRSADSNVGYRVSYLDGKMIGEPQATAANPGTTIVVQDLFYNNPVRRAGLGRPTEEYNRIVEVIQRYALARHADCGFAVRRSPSTVDLVTKAGADPLDIVRLIWGAQVASALQPISLDEWASGLVSSAYHQQKIFTFILFINGRLVESVRIKRAISTLYAEILLAGAHPFIFLSLKIPGTGVDVNVHPTKREVILLHEDEIIGKLTSGIRECLSQKGHIPGETPVIRTMSVANADLLSQTAALRVGGGGPITSPSNGLSSLLPSTIIEESSSQSTVAVQSFVPAPSAVPLASASSSSSLLSLSLSSASSAPGPGPASVSASTPTSTSASASASILVRPFRQIHTDHKRRTLDSFMYCQQQQQQRIKTTSDSNSKGESVELCTIAPEPVTDKPREQAIDTSRETTLQALKRDSSPEATEIISRHTLVGWLDDHRIFIQCDTALLLVNVREVTREWLRIALTCGGRPRTMTPVSRPLRECLQTFLRDNPQAADVDPERLIGEILEMMWANHPTLDSLAGIKIDHDRLIGLPSLPEPITLPPPLPTVAIEHSDALIGQLIFRLAVDCDLEATDDAFPVVGSALCDYFLTLIPWSDHQWVEHVLLPILRKPPIPYPGSFLRNGTLLRAATTYDLYRVFERC